MWRRSGRIEDRARARVDSKAGEAEGRRCGAWGEHLLVPAVPAKLSSIRDGSRRDALQQGSRLEGPDHGRTQRGFEGGSPNPAGGLGGAVSPPAGSGAEPRKILKLTLFRG